MAKVKGGWVKGCKERGEWAELCFMARARGLGLGVLKPYGDSGRYDVAVENGAGILRVQVKSTIYCRRGGEYSLNVMGPGRKQYEKGSVDFFAVYVIPRDEWYIIPYEAMRGRLTLHFTPGSKRSKWTEYLEAWELLGGRIEIQACVDVEWVMEKADSSPALAPVRNDISFIDDVFRIWRCFIWRCFPYTVCGSAND